MSPFFNLKKNLTSQKAHVPPGIYHYQSPPDDPDNTRYHLRIEGTGDGILIINASTILHLNQTAASYAYFMIRNTPPDQVSKIIAAAYQVHPEQARQDYLDLVAQIQTLVKTPDLDPVTFLDFERRQPYSVGLSAPYRLDCAVTYALPDQGEGIFAPVERVARELDTDDWYLILEKAWHAGIPHVIFTGGEPTLRADLPVLVHKAEELGMVCGILSDGVRLLDQEYFNRVLQAGLDHLMLILQPENAQSWLAVENSLVEDLAVIIHLTITNDDLERTKSDLQRLSSMGVSKISLSASDPLLNPALQAARDQAAALGLELIWNIPVPYCRFHPVAMEIGDAQLEGAGRAWLYVEPDGDVRPSQGDQKVLGNLLTDSWEKIWKQQVN